MRINPLLLSTGCALLLALPASAQSAAMPESYRQVQLNALELERKTLLAMVDSMPENLYHDKVTPIQRDFSQQIEHASGSVVFIVTRFLGATGPARPDSAKSYLNSRAGLRGYVNAVYDWAGNVLKTQSESDRSKTVDLFGTKMPGWQVWDEIHQHTFWTAGQIVANFRKNGMAPPGFGFF
jgi:DinB superfamily